MPAFNESPPMLDGTGNQSGGSIIYSVPIFPKVKSQSLETLSAACVLHFPDERQNSKIKDLRLAAQRAHVSGAARV
jgi:hypothetical protein